MNHTTFPPLFPQSTGYKKFSKRKIDHVGDSRSFNELNAVGKEGTAVGTIVGTAWNQGVGWEDEKVNQNVGLN